MKNERTQQWADALRNTALPQAQGALGVVEHDKIVGYCCLGLGALKAGIEPVIYTDKEEAKFDGAAGVAPRRFLLWLGFTTEEINQTIGESAVEAQIYLDAPAKMLLGPRGTRWDGLSALNDHHVTFAQIADLIEYFGVRLTQTIY